MIYVYGMIMEAINQMDVFMMFIPLMRIMKKIYVIYVMFMSLICGVIKTSSRVAALCRRSPEKMESLKSTKMSLRGCSEMTLLYLRPF